MTARDERPRALAVASWSEAEESPLLTVEQAAALLAVPPSWLKQRVAAHAIACTRLGRHVRFTHEQLTALIAASEQPVAPAPMTGLTRRSRRPA